ncbi:Excisionase/Xis, DNA-binding domain protein [Candidatus Magnetoovum chiemensis]|nr:Excisionase/Xis, DNA-binding domain protein [Candidatus Magnetoovum chiemensis]
MPKLELPNKALFCPKEAAEFLRVSRRTLYDWIQQGRLQASRLSGKTVRIHRDDLTAFLEKTKRE